MRKGVLELCILAIIAQSEEVYSSDILEQLKQAELIVVEGTLYPLLTRLKNDGMLSYRWEESRSGPPRKYFRISAQGQQLLSQLTQTWEAMTEAVSQILYPSNKNHNV
ncbi:MAG: PadR family transcriptional regulator [Bacteroidales bacterium]|nr:PadR family transcriptional regulator [Bacteroidales bacterium]